VGVWQVCHFFGFFFRRWKIEVSSPEFMLKLFGYGFRPSVGGALHWANAQPTHIRATGYALRPMINFFSINQKKKIKPPNKIMLQIPFKALFYFVRSPI
jgi:hypothetical protein